jgi:hypothetical protein
VCFSGLRTFIKSPGLGYNITPTANKDQEGREPETERETNSHVTQRHHHKQHMPVASHQQTRQHHKGDQRAHHQSAQRDLQQKGQHIVIERNALEGYDTYTLGTSKVIVLSVSPNISKSLFFSITAATSSMVKRLMRV